MNSLFQEGKNCWRIAHAERVAFLIDGEPYFRALHEAICRAQRSVFLVGWDIHSKLRLLRDDDDAEEMPVTLAALFDAVAADRPDLHIYVSSWDFAMIYAMEREFFPKYRLRWKSHERVHFCLDGEHPVGASQHQKVAVIDDQLAFCGGIDLSQWRWDTSKHRIDDERRTDPSGSSYPPFHDVQIALSGEAAAALGQMVRERWRLVSDVEPRDDGADPKQDVWPPSVTPALEHVDVAIARTLPAHGDREEVREVENLYLDSIEAAERFIYIENQYLSCNRVGDALAGRLSEENGPEIVIVAPEETGGWLEQHTMDVLRARLLRRLRAADSHDRLRIYDARLAEEPHVSLMIHAKIMVVDDVLARVGSSNLSNRSMGLDSECDLAIEAGSSEDHRAAITEFRRRLLAEHLDVDIAAVAEAEGEHGSLLSAIESLRGGARTLEPLSGEVAEEVDRLVPDSAVLDPEKPVDADELLGAFVDSDDRQTERSGALRVLSLAVAVLGLAALWRWTPLGDWLSIDRLASVGEWIEGRPLTPLYLLLAYVVAALAVVPITLLFVSTVVVFGPWVGMAYAVLGAEVAALATFAIGRALGRDTVRRFAGSRVNRISRKLSERGVVTTITLRIVPVAPFTVINVIAGVSDVRLRDFAVGNALGVLPGVIGVAFLTDRIVASLRDPSLATVAALVGVVVLVGGALFALRRWLQGDAKGQ
ncbi:MAG: hypothetical protein HKP36_18705 [Myxococcales bacterium]|nr:VTT domain-containing protein [Deltaproteobacteria bacterium]NNL26465.1 hypothetical protein [Myxococcales bacterium]